MSDVPFANPDESLMMEAKLSEELGRLQNSDWVADKRLHTEFYLRTTQNAHKSAAAGRPIFDEIEYVRIERLGDSLNKIDVPVNDIHRARFADRYAKWVEAKRQNDAVTGTPLTAWTELSRGDAESLRMIGIKTVEMLLDMDDGMLSKWPGLRTIQKNARDWLDVAARTAAASQLRAEKDELNGKLAAQATEMADLRAQLAKMQALTEALVAGEGTKKGKGR